MFHTRYIPCMERTPPPSPTAAERRDQTRAFGQWLRDRLTERDYVLGTGRAAGGQRKLARQTGLSFSAISRLLAGETLNPDPDSLRRIAEATALPFGELLTRAGVLRPDELRAFQRGRPADAPPLTPEQAAADLGIVDPVAVQMFVANVEAARAAQKQQRSDRERAD